MMIDTLMLMNLCILCSILMVLVYKFMLMILMMMEMLVVSISILMYLNFSLFNMEIYMFYYLMFSVCESVLGLMILILVIRFNGNEFYFSMNLFKFI